MASKYVKNFTVPTDFPSMLHDFAREVLKMQPADIHEFGAIYFQALEEGVDYRDLMNPNAARQNAEQPHVDHQQEQQQHDQAATPTGEDMAAEIQQHILSQGQDRNSLPNMELYSEEHQRSKAVLTGLGGSLGQIYNVVAAVMGMYKGDMQAYYDKIQKDPAAAAQKPSSAIELIGLENNFIPFLLRYLDTRQFMTISASAEIHQLLGTFGIHPDGDNCYDLTSLSKEQYYQFRNQFIEQRNHDQTLQEAEHQEGIDLMLRSCCLAMCKKIPDELEIDSSINQRIKLVGPLNLTKPLQAVVALESDQAYNQNTQSLPYRVQIINREAQAVLRADFIDAIASELGQAGAQIDAQAISQTAARICNDQEQTYFQRCNQKGMQVIQF